MSEHIGKILQEKLKEPGMPTAKDFADLMGMSTRTLYNVFNKDSVLTIDQAVKASEILKTDLIGEYLKAADKLWILQEPEIAYQAKKKIITINIQVQSDIDQVDKFPEFLREINEMANRRGLKIA